MEMKFYLENGQVLDFDKDTIEKVDVDVLVRALAKENRFYNQINYSVLQHSLACFYAGQLMFEGNDLLLAHLLCHDLHEALIRDVPRMVKTKDFKKLEDSIASKLHEALRLRPLSSEDTTYLKLIDDAMATVEAYNNGTPELVEVMIKHYDRDYGSVEESTLALMCCMKGYEYVENSEMYLVVNSGTEESPMYETVLNPAIYETFREVLRQY